MDFSQAKRDPESGKLCVLEEKEVDTLLKKPILECTHRSGNRSMDILLNKPILHVDSQYFTRIDCFW